MSRRIPPRASSHFARDAVFFAERIDPGTNLIADSACSCQPFLVRAREFGRIVERPVQPGSDASKNWTTFSLNVTTHCHHKWEYLSGCPNVENALRCVLRDINSELQKRFHDQRIDCAWFYPALCASKNSPHVSF